MGTRNMTFVAAKDIVVGDWMNLAWDLESNLVVSVTPLEGGLVEISTECDVWIGAADQEFPILRKEGA